MNELNPGNDCLFQTSLYMRHYETKVKTEFFAGGASPSNLHPTFTAKI